jgi:(4-(4-[2-(gamma-L-glutamylamino)ethyl]phenoxymethyl)furan-2-yl)methanamine synthase
MPITAGYDVGGAHLKVALAQDGRTIAVRQIACPLWQGIEHLDAAFAGAEDLVSRADVHAATMTGELCEIFPDRATGVRVIIDRLKALLPSFQVWMGINGFGAPDAAEADPMRVGSTNFLASAALVALRLPDALLVDMGSTTTDIVAVKGGNIAVRGLTDGDRLRTGELVYTGLTRPDVSFVTQRGTFQGRTQRLAAGSFANMADVRRVLGTLPRDVDQHATLDGRGKSDNESLERFARCFGRDASEALIGDWQVAARNIATQQMHEIGAAIEEVLAAAALPTGAPIVAAGIGADEIAKLAVDAGREVNRFGDLASATDECRTWATRCAPAVALAVLANGEG